MNSRDHTKSTNSGLDIDFLRIEIELLKLSLPIINSCRLDDIKSEPVKTKVKVKTNVKVKVKTKVKPKKSREPDMLALLELKMSLDKLLPEPIKSYKKDAKIKKSEYSKCMI